MRLQFGSKRRLIVLGNTLRKNDSHSRSKLVRASGALKLVKRAGWVKKVGITSDGESVADHSFRMAIIGLEEGMKLRLDSFKIVRMCLIHDLAESVIGDKLPGEKISPSEHRRDEDKIMHQLLSDSSSTSSKILLNDWLELLESKTSEAKLVWKIDKMEMAIQARDYERMGYDSERLMEFTKPSSC